MVLVYRVGLMVARPFLLLDVDGVLNPLVPKMPDGFVRHELLGYEVFLSPRHGAWLNVLGERFDLVWATTWEHDAPLLIAPILGLPRDLPVIEFSRGRVGETWKLHDVRDFVGDRPMAWIDDELGPDAFTWAEQREPPTLLLQTDRNVGLTKQHISQLESFGPPTNSAT